MNHEMENLLRQMNEAALLAPDHPRRRQLVQQIVDQGPEAQQQWLQRLGDDEKLRLMLHRVDSPAGLTQALLSIPDEGVVKRAWRPVGLNLWALGLAAMLLFTAGLGVWVFSADSSAAFQDQQKQRIAAMILQDHLQSPALSVMTSDSHQVEQQLSGHLPHPTVVPTICETFTLVGGTRSVINDQPVVYTRWICDGREFSLYQFCPSNFDLPQDIPRQDLNPLGSDEEGGNALRVVIWTHQHCAYALVVDSSHLESVLSNPV